MKYSIVFSRVYADIGMFTSASVDVRWVELLLQQYKPDGRFYTLADYEVKPFSTVLLMIVLFEIAEDFNADDNHVIFDLSWNYPSTGRDFLDASCLIFMGDTWYVCHGFKHLVIYTMTVV